MDPFSWGQCLAFSRYSQTHKSFGTSVCTPGRCRALGPWRRTSRALPSAAPSSMRAANRTRCRDENALICAVQTVSTNSMWLLSTCSMTGVPEELTFLLSCG